jgi:hypothetical protein
MYTQMMKINVNPSARGESIDAKHTVSLICVSLNYLQHLLIASIPRLKVTLHAILQSNGRDLFSNYLTTLFQLHKL